MKKNPQNPRIVISTIAIMLFLSSSAIILQDFYIFDSNGQLEEGYKIGVDSHLGDRSWLKSQGTYMEMAYPGTSNQWGAVFITIGDPQPDFQKADRDARSYESFDKMVVDLKGAKGGEKVAIGMKDKQDLNDGSETKITVTLTSEWKTYEFDLNRFRTANLKEIHVPIEFVFEGTTKRTVSFRSVRFHMK